MVCVQVRATGTGPRCTLIQHTAQLVMCTLMAVAGGVDADAVSHTTGESRYYHWLRLCMTFRLRTIICIPHKTFDGWIGEWMEDIAG